MRKLLGGNIMVRQILNKLDKEIDKVQEGEKHWIGKSILIGAIEGAVDSLFLWGGVAGICVVTNSISKVIKKRGS
jgi:hypothetical protein